MSKHLTEEKRNILRQALDKYAWPGGYPVFLITSDGGVLCPDCVRSEIREIIGAIRRMNAGRSGWLPEGVGINWEDPHLYCDHCNKRIESAYAEEEDSDDD